MDKSKTKKSAVSVYDALHREGLFLPFTKRMAKATKGILLESFAKNKVHYSPSGLTARIVVDSLLQERQLFVVYYDPGIGYTVSLHRPGKVHSVKQEKS